MKQMKKFQIAAAVALIVNVILIVYAVAVFRVDDMTLSKGAVIDFNEGWVMERADGSREEIGQLPYKGKSEPDEVILLKNQISEEFRGKTLVFFTEDVRVQVWLDGRILYEFGMKDQKSFGKTPGSLVNFVNIPRESKDTTIVLKLVSPYRNAAANFYAMAVAERDISILQLLKQNLGNIICSVLMLLCGVIFILLAVLQHFTKVKVTGLHFFGLFSIDAAIYFFIKTWVMTIFYGNQTLYHLLVFMGLMMLPLLLIIYYCNHFKEHFKRTFCVLMILNCLNVVLQVFLQMFNICDDTTMAEISYVLMIAVILVAMLNMVKRLKTERSWGTLLELAAIFCMGIGGIIDFVYKYVIQTGYVAKYSRYGCTGFCVLMLSVHIYRLVKQYMANVKEDARLLEEQVKMVERQNVQLVQAKEEAEEAKREAVAANKAKGKFLARMSHEIRTPLNAVLGMDEMILRETTEAEIKEYAVDIQSAGSTLLALINDILDISKIESGKMEILSVEYDLSSLLHDLSNMISLRAKAKDLKFIVEAEGGLPSRMRGDDVRLRQVLINMLTNAVKYTKKGSVTLSVTGHADGGNEILHFEVRDTGIGIKEEDISRLYEEFARIEEERNRNIEGTGLGMNIATQLLGLMGSHMEVKSVYGEGSVFFFDIVQPIVNADPIGDLEKRMKQQSKDYVYRNSFVAPDARILMADDNAINRKVFVNLLKQTKVQVDAVAGGLECLKLVEKEHYDLIFLDHMMPELDGVETLHKMKEMEHNLCKDTPVVVLTANAVTGAREQYLKEGFDDFISKPLDPDKLEKLIRNMIAPEKIVLEGKKS